MSKLTLLATPIGNLSDISQRAIECLKKADFIAAEDTRVTIKLLNHLGIKKHLISYHEHNMKEKSDLIIDRILSGEDCVLVSDAGMPAISDPGELLVKLCYDNDIKVSVIPGACAAICAIAISGLSTSRFTFEGFLTVNKKNRLKHLKELKDEKRTMIFYESPHKIERTLNDLFDFFGDREVAIVRELTKVHEEVIRTTLGEAINIYNENNRPKGEFVIILDGKKDLREEAGYSHDDIVKLIKATLNKNYSKTETAKIVAKKVNLSKSEVYKIILEICP